MLHHRHVEVAAAHVETAAGGQTDTPVAACGDLAVGDDVARGHALDASAGAAAGVEIAAEDEVAVARVQGDRATRHVAVHQHFGTGADGDGGSTQIDRAAGPAA